MKNIFKMIFGAVALASSCLSADCDHNTYKTNNFMIPVGRIVFNPELQNSNMAFSAFGEVGVRNYRASATAAAWTTERSRLKVTGEYLTQKLGWNFTTGRVNHWVHQGAGGLDWQYLLDDCYCFQAFDVKGYYSYAEGKNLHDGVCTLPGAAPQSFSRHLAGSNAAGGSLNTVMVFGETHRLDISLDYDYVKYRRRLDSDKKVHGLGGSFLWVTRLPCCIDFSLEGQFRRPFNYFGARLTWPKNSNQLNSNITLFGGWTRGKYNLPNSLKVGVELVYDFSLGNSCCEKVQECCRPLWNPCDLNAWAVVPAVYMPEVLVIRDECRTGITAPLGPITIPEYPSGFSYSYNFSQNFDSNAPLTYSATGLPPNTTLDPVTGVMSGVISGGASYDISVTASNPCSSVTQVFTLNVQTA